MHPCAHAGLIMHIEITHVPMDNSEVEYESVGVYKTIISSIIYLLCYLFLGNKCYYVCCRFIS